MPLYFIAIVAPVNINEEVSVFKNYMRVTFGCKVALRSPAHITLVPPFQMPADKENELMKFIASFWSQEKPFKIELRNFAAFKPRVIYVDVVMSEALSRLKHAFEEFIIDAGYPVNKETRPFHPHVTIANRDLDNKDFAQAWEHFGEAKYEASFEVNGIDLLRRERDEWRILPRDGSQTPQAEHK